jgi:hypothetical protein
MLTGNSSSPVPGTNAPKHRKIGILWTLYGRMRIVAAAWLMLDSKHTDALPWLTFFQVLLVLLTARCVISACFSSGAGFALIRGSASTRLLGPVAAVALPE